MQAHCILTRFIPPSDHTFGSCLDNGIPHTHHLVDTHESNTTSCGPRVSPEIGTTHHFLGTFYGFRTEKDSDVMDDWHGPFYKDEYSELIDHFGHTIDIVLKPMERDARGVVSSTAVHPVLRFNRVEGEPIMG